MTSHPADRADLDLPTPPDAPKGRDLPSSGSTGSRASGRPRPLRRASALTGLDVVTLAGERDVEVKDVVFDKARGRLTGFTLRKPGLLGGPQKRVLPVEAVVAVGRDAVMIESHGVFVAPEALEASGDDVIGDRVLTDDGVELGTVADVVVSVEGGEADILGFEVTATPAILEDGGVVFVPLPAAMAISGEAVVVPSQARDHITTDIDELAGAAEQLRREAGRP